MSTPYVFTVNGSTVNVRNGWSLRQTANHVDILTFEVWASNASYYQPALDDEVVVTKGATTIFGGIVTQPNISGIGDEGSARNTNARITASSHDVRIDRRSLQCVRPSESLKDRLTYLVTYLGPFGISLSASQVTGPTLAAKAYDWQTLRSILDDTTIQTGGWVYQVTPDKDLLMVDPTTNTAPFSISSGDGHIIGDLKVEPKRTNYCNRVIAQTTNVTASTAEVLAGDGAARSWIVPDIVKSIEANTLVMLSLVDIGGSVFSITWWDGAGGYQVSGIAPCANWTAPSTGKQYGPTGADGQDPPVAGITHADLQAMLNSIPDVAAFIPIVSGGGPWLIHLSGPSADIKGGLTGSDAAVVFLTPGSVAHIDNSTQTPDAIYQVGSYPDDLPYTFDNVSNTLYQKSTSPAEPIVAVGKSLVLACGLPLIAVDADSGMASQVWDAFVTYDAKTQSELNAFAASYRGVHELTDQTMEFDTHTEGLLPGMLLSINVPPRNVNSVQSIITDVTLTLDAEGIVSWAVTCQKGSVYLANIHWSDEYKSWGTGGGKGGSAGGGGGSVITTSGMVFPLGGSKADAVQSPGGGPVQATPYKLALNPTDIGTANGIVWVQIGSKSGSVVATFVNETTGHVVGTSTTVTNATPQLVPISVTLESGDGVYYLAIDPTIANVTLFAIGAYLRMTP